jgi:aminoglycoside phosphotransferase (APT) family kinase protein
VTNGFAGFKPEEIDGLVDEARLAAWLDAQGIAPGAPLRVSRISGGLSNESLGVERGGTRHVLRRPAQRALAGADRGMRREFRLLSALEGTPVPHPSPIALCDDREVLGCVFYVMSYVDGFLPTEPLPSEWATPESRRAMSFSAVEAMAALHAVDWRAQGLADLGRIDGFHARQRTRWLSQYYAYPSQLLDGIDDVGGWLEANPPAEWTATIMHGDVNGNNLLVTREHPPVVAALLDWETATIGDPLLDVAGFKRTWTERRKGDGWPSADELLAHYAVQSGRTLDDLTYYDVLYRFKFAVLVEGIYQRSLSDHTRTTAIDLHEFGLDMIDSARRLAGI